MTTKNKTLFSRNAVRVIFEDHGYDLSRRQIERMVASGDLRSVELSGKLFIYTDSIKETLDKLDALKTLRDLSNALDLITALKSIGKRG